MKKSIFIFTICFGQSLSGLFAQEVIANEEVIQEINKDIWLPFMDSYVRKDYELFNSLYTDDALRINSWSGIRLGREYKERIEASFSQSKSSKSQIYFAFFERYQYGDIAYENGISRFLMLIFM